MARHGSKAVAASIAWAGTGSRGHALTGTDDKLAASTRDVLTLLLPHRRRDAVLRTQAASQYASFSWSRGKRCRQHFLLQ
jgi:hypothetical protein